MKTLTKEEAAEYFAAFHFKVDEDVRALYRIFAKAEDDPDEPLKLLKVSVDTPPMGVLPLNFPPDEQNGIPFRYLLAVVTPEEFEQIVDGRLHLPDGWQLGQTIRTRKARSKAAA